jgi:hypothetical protein
MKKKYESITNEQYRDLREITYRNIDNIIPPKIKRVNPFKSHENVYIINTPEIKPLIDAPLSPAEYEEYLAAMKSPNVPTLTALGANINSPRLEGIYDYSKSVDWNLRGYQQWRIEQVNNESSEYKELLLEGYNNKADIEAYKNSVNTVFFYLLDYLYSGIPNDFEKRIRTDFSGIDMTLDSFISYTTNKSILWKTPIHRYNKKYLQKLARTILYKYNSK